MAPHGIHYEQVVANTIAIVTLISLVTGLVGRAIVGPIKKRGDILNQAILENQQLLKEMKGNRSVSDERWEAVSDWRKAVDKHLEAIDLSIMQTHTGMEYMGKTLDRLERDA